MLMKSDNNHSSRKFRLRVEKRLLKETVVNSAEHMALMKMIKCTDFGSD
jgi:hypothetical protein